MRDNTRLDPLVISRTMLQEYEDSADGYDSQFSDELAKESMDHVEGTESLYHSLLRLTVNTSDVNSVQGTEGLMDFIKTGFNKLGEWIKKFVTWLGEVFGGKTKEIERKLEGLEDKIKGGELKDSADYPMVAWNLMPLNANKLDDDLGWLLDFQHDMHEHLDHNKTFFKGVMDALRDELIWLKTSSSSEPQQAAERIPPFIDKMKRVFGSLHGKVKTTDETGINFTDNIYGSYTLVIDIDKGRFTVGTVPGSQNREEAKFKPTANVIQKVYYESNKIAEKIKLGFTANEMLLKTMTKDLEAATPKLTVFDENYFKVIKTWAMCICDYIKKVGILGITSQTDLIKILHAAYK